MWRLTSILLGCFAFCSTPLGLGFAAVQYTAETVIAPEFTAPGYYDPSADFSARPSNVDILSGLLPIENAGDFGRELSLGVPVLTDGSISTTIAEVWPGIGLNKSYASGGLQAGTSITYALSSIYDIVSIAVFGGWQDSGRDEQHYSIYTSSDFGANFELLTTYNESNFSEDDGYHLAPITHRVEFYEDSLGELARDVTHLRFDFHAVENGWSGYQEIDVFGTACYDCNNPLDITDFYEISDNFLTVPSVVGEDGDLNFDNIIDARDFRLWKNITGGVTAQLDSRVIPEPTTLALLALCQVVSLSFKRRNQEVKVLGGRCKM